MCKWFFLACRHKNSSIKSMILWQSDIPGGKHAGNKNIKSTVRGHEVYIWRLTSLLISLQCRRTIRRKPLGCKGFGKITFLEAKLIIHLTISWDRHHSYNGKKINIHRDFAMFTVYSTEWHIVYSL